MNHKGHEGGTRGQWMKHKQGMMGAMDETQAGHEGGMRGQWMKYKGVTKGA